MESNTLRTPRIVLKLGAALAGAVLLLSGCTAATGAPDTESAVQQRAFPTVYDQKIDWQTCGPQFKMREGLEDYILEQGGHVTGLRCAMIAAPLDWTDVDNNETIELAITHIPATGDKPIGTLLSNPGGPGASGIDYALGLTGTPAFDEVHEKYDLLGFDPRGIERSSAVECESQTEIIALQMALCAKENPLALSMGTNQVARDMELMRHLMGDESLNYAGFSYGTVIGASYATLFPEHIGRIMLDSAWPSDWSSPLGSYEQLEAVVYAKRDLLIGCESSYAVAQCPINSEESLLQKVSELNATPLLATDGTEVTGDMLSGYLTTALYYAPEGRSAILETVGRVVSGDQSAIDELATAMADGGSSVGLSGSIVRCLSSPRDPNLVGLYDYINEHGLPQELGGPEINDDTLGDFLELKCEALPNSGQDFQNFTNQSDKPILVFGITGDHATPYQGAQQLVDELGNATLVTLEGSGHIASFQNRSTCADDIAVAYLVRGELPPKGTVCTDD
jgi:pimeloyl-ACP methyl ester carboxylesterase